MDIGLPVQARIINPGRSGPHRRAGLFSDDLPLDIPTPSS
jgi:hypothetical protein